MSFVQESEEDTSESSEVSFDTNVSEENFTNPSNARARSARALETGGGPATT